MERSAQLAIAQTALSALLWGTSFPLTAYGLKEGLGPLTFVFLRFALAVPLMVLICVTMGKKLLPLVSRKEVWILGILNALGFLCQYIGQQYTQASLAALLINMSVIFAAAGGAVFLGEKLGAGKAVGVALAISGTVLITTNGSVSSLGGAQLLGVSLYLVSAISWAVYIVYAKQKTEQLALDPAPLATWIVMITALILVPLAALSGEGLPTGSVSVEVVVYMALLNTAIPFILYQQGLGKLTAGLSAVVLMLEIVVALVVSVLLLGEAPTYYDFVGGIAILSSILLVSGAEFGGKSLSVAEEAVGGVKDV